MNPDPHKNIKAFDFIQNYNMSFDKDGNSLLVSMLIEFAKFHVENALQAAADIATVGNIYSNNSDEWVNKDEILNSYPLTNIK